uniref:Uncharacterized protein n=1 Tax=Anguilla anguilla TaxID=7936 RepID=A0A0E9PBP8_ANGAN
MPEIAVHSKKNENTYVP